VAELVSLDEVRAAARRLQGITVRTPLVPFPAGGPAQAQAQAPARVLIKPESLQPTGAFKLRGAYNAIASLPEADRRRGVVAHSSGNHGYAVAYAAALLGVKAAIVVPDNAPAIKTDAILAAGAELVRVRPTLAARIEAAQHIADTRGYAPIPPFDDRRVIAGQGTIGLEIAEDSSPHAPAAVLVPVSGGGLISGIAVAIRALTPRTKVIGVEPELAADARESFRTGIRVAWPASDVARTAADSLRVEQVGELTFPHIQALVDDIVTVTEEEMLAAVARLATHARLVAEPGGAAAVAAAMFRSPAELGLAGGGAGGPLVAILSGGNIDPALLARVLTPRRQSYTG
jgi:threo-3-hydroxy-L-aspartate ammonia-lyase